MKKSMIIITFILPLLIGCSSKLDYNEAYFGKEKYQETKYEYTTQELSQIQPILSEIEEAFSYLDIQVDCKEKFGVLAKYCLCKENYPTISSETHSVEVVTVRLLDDQGYIWISYSQQGSDKDNKAITASDDVLSRIELKKENDEWIAISIEEAM